MRSVLLVLVFLIFLLAIFSISLIAPEFQFLHRGVETLGTKWGRLFIGGAAPQVMEIYINDELTTDIPATSFQIDANPDGDRSLTIKAWIYDENGDCNTFTGVTAYLCEALFTGSTECDENLAATDPDHTISMSWDGTQWGAFNENCNFTGGAPSYLLHYYERWEDWGINVTVIDADGLANNTNKTWYYISSPGFDYPYGESVTNLGTVYVGQWNDGAGCDPADMPNGCWLKNQGNIRLNVTWNTTNFTREELPFAEIDINGTNFCVDNDTVNTIGIETCLDDIPEIQVEWPTDLGRIRRCGDSPCVIDEDGGLNQANFSVYWHIALPSGLLAGYYNNTIEMTGDTYYDSF